MKRCLWPSTRGEVRACIKTGRCFSDSDIPTVSVRIYAATVSMATRRLLTNVYEGRYLFRKDQNALRGNVSAQFWETLESQRFDLRFLQRRAVVIPSQSGARQTVIHGDCWGDELKNLNKAAGDHLRLDFRPSAEKISSEEKRRLLRLVQIDDLRKTLRQIPNACISRKELLQICVDYTGEEGGKEVVKSLDKSGQVFIVGDCVYLRPEQVARVMENVLPLLKNPRREELEEMEKQKAEIDAEAEKIVRREIWGGLGFMSFQTAYLMWLTFWELSWDVMEPICFFLTSTYFLAGYAFFLTTSSDPTFEGFFHARFKTTQKRLMKKRNFDLERFEELRKIGGPPLRHSAYGGLFHAI